MNMNYLNYQSNQIHINIDSIHLNHLDYHHHIILNQLWYCLHIKYFSIFDHYLCNNQVNIINITLFYKYYSLNILECNYHIHLFKLYLHRHILHLLLYCRTEKILLLLDWDGSSAIGMEELEDPLLDLDLVNSRECKR